MVAARHEAEIRALAAARLPGPMAEVIARASSLFVQVINDVEIERMALGRVCLIGDAAFLARPHAAAGTAKAAADAWALAEALTAHDDVEAALAAWEPGQLGLGARLVARARRMGERSQIDCTWVPGDPELLLGLHGPGR
jgi:2,6-dihydroxypyridine 3-monooxygenase